MAETDWADLSSNLDSNTVARGVTAGITPPNGGGSFVFGCNSLLATEGVVGKYVNKANFAPMQISGPQATGGSIRGVLQRGVSGSPQTGFAPLLFLHLKSGITAAPPDVSDTGYLLGLEDSDPARIVLRKGSPLSGLSVDTTSATLRYSSASYNPGTWVHLRLDAIYNPNGDVVLRCFENDLDANPVTAPDWQAIPGMDDYIDDALAINSGSLPLNGGFAGFAFYVNNLQKRGHFDHIEVLRQL